MIRKTLFAIILLVLFNSTASSQTTVRFQVDVSAQIKDSTFVPSQDYIEITGNQLPFSKTRNIRLKKEPAPADSIYSAVVRFPSIVNGEVLRYFYIIDKERQKFPENGDRLLQLQKQKITLPLQYFGVITQ